VTSHTAGKADAGGADRAASTARELIPDLADVGATGIVELPITKLVY
jgi:hypothetical protein